MRTRLPKTWIVCFICLSTVACLRSLDSNKIPCTTSDRCPSSYTCVAGYCKRGSGPDSGTASDATSVSDGPRSERGDVGLATQPDSATPTLNPDAPLTGTGGVSDAALGGTSGGSGTIGTGGAGGSTGTGGTTATGGIATSGAPATGGGTAGTGNTSGIGGVTVTSLTTTGGATLTTSTAVTGGTTGSGGKGGSSGGATSSGGVTASGGASSVVTGGASSGGVSASGGNSSAVTGGSSATSSATCQPKPRDCTSTLDNNCNGIPDNQETSSCACPVGQKRDCLEHPGNDGKGPCKAGSQTCQASSDKTTSTWNDCSGAIAPSTEVCDPAGVDENCDGQSNEGCECVNGTSIPCDCGPATTCTNGRKGTCSVTKVTLYRDLDGDGFGNSAQPAMKCPGESGYVSNANDCDDSPSGASFYPGVSICSTAMEKRSCPATGGTTRTDPCDDGCINNDCRHDGTIGVPGYVSCTATHTPRCPTPAGCNLLDGSCDSPSARRMECDGPGDCGASETCCVQSFPGGVQTVCKPGTCGLSEQVCDPLANTCTCTAKEINGYYFNTCS